jgi:hypothetical protein
MVAWLAGFTAFQTTKVIIHFTSGSKRRTFNLPAHPTALGRPFLPLSDLLL